ncbi:hypothetical protein [Rhizobium tubonense]|nr:hypothetical protein [Rhizobium tubonense]
MADPSFQYNPLTTAVESKIAGPPSRDRDRRRDVGDPPLARTAAI